MVLSGVFWAGAAKSVVTSLALLGVQKYVNPLYSNRQCSMRAVNESNPVGYAVHPFWKDLVYDDSCEGMVEEYAAQQTNDTAHIESLAAFYTSRTLAAIFAFAIVSYFLDIIRKTGIVRGAARLLFVQMAGFMMGTVFLMHVHFMQDITYLTGATMHHARDTALGLDAKRGTITQGYFLCGALHRMFLQFAVYQLVKNDSRLRKFVSPIVAAGLLELWTIVMVNEVKRNHPRYHAFATPDMEPGLPYTWANRAYMHCIVHHETGYSFSGDPLLDPVYDLFLEIYSMLHNKVLQIGLTDPLHHVFSTAFDVVMGLFGAALIWVGLHGFCFLYNVVTYPFTPATKANGTKATKAD